MESHKNKVLRIVKNIYNIGTRKIVEITNSSDETLIFKCKCINGNYDLYDMLDNNISWGLSCETLDELRDALLNDFMEGLFNNIKCK